MNCSQAMGFQNNALVRPDARVTYIVC